MFSGRSQKLHEVDLICAPRPPEKVNFLVRRDKKNICVLYKVVFLANSCVYISYFIYNSFKWHKKEEFPLLCLANKQKQSRFDADLDEEGKIFTRVDILALEYIFLVCFILLSHKGSHKEAFQDFQPCLTSFAGGSKSCFDTSSVHPQPTLTNC